MRGISRHTGQNIDAMTHLRQDIEDVLTTPLGTRVGRRDYGSRLPDRVDRPMSADLVVDVTLDSADAIAKWIPIFKLTRVFVALANKAGRLELGIEGEYAGNPVTIEGLLV